MLFYVLFCVDCVVLCTVCVSMCTVLLPPGVYPIAVKYIISYHISASLWFYYKNISRCTVLWKSNSTLHSRACLFLANHLTLCALSNWFVILVNAKISKFRLKQGYKREISGFLGEVAENCALFGYYAASSTDFTPTFRDNLSPHLQALEDVRR